MKTKKKIKKGLKYFLSAIIIGAALYLNVVAGKYIYDEGRYFLESPECLSEETFVIKNVILRWDPRYLRPHRM